MNLAAIANGAITAINPNFPATLYISTGNVVIDFKQTPTYGTMPIAAQVQPLTSGELRQLDALNIQGASKAIYLNGAALGIIRIKQRGGDLIVFPAGTLPEGDVWLVKASLEQWQGATWAKVAVELQDDDVLKTALTTDLSQPGNQIIVPAILTGI
jgi:hypothetical protein